MFDKYYHNLKKALSHCQGEGELKANVKKAPERPGAEIDKQALRQNIFDMVGM